MIAVAACSPRSDRGYERCPGGECVCAAGFADCDGQVMVMHDLLGLEPAWKPRFVRRYAEMGKSASEAFAAYAADVRAGKFPGPGESYD